MDVPTIEEGSVVLRPLTDADSDALFRWINDHDTVVFNAPFAPVEREAHERWFERVRASTSIAIFGIMERHTRALVGSCQLLNISPLHRSADLQIRLGEPAARGRGLGTDAVRGLVHFGMTQLKLHRIALTVRADNERAIRAYVKCGFQREGLLREAAFIEGRFVDLIGMAVLAS
ncbi:GNAT family protein [Ramlibacter tataouinensis]|uniref:GNAT family N-acetyltransferase n=1 Tax=Ramlibacter tataouinensis TaxID=94132 RepID=UPI0022F3CE23|nr:GNAT family protein [Ramlibacter tataouinensis]WBY00711.1 GNAT family protein [Ramlibacter tataouinensis]